MLDALECPLVLGCKNGPGISYGVRSVFPIGPLVVVQRNTKYYARVGKWPQSDNDFGALKGRAVGAVN
jgi:hypothetical protein